MRHDPRALLLHVGDAFSPLFRHGPDFRSSQTGHSWTVSGGQSNCMWNWAGVTDASPESRAVIRGFAADLRERGFDGLLCYPPDAEAPLADTFRDLGLGEAGAVPLMVYDPADVPPVTPSHVVVERVTDPATLALAVAVMAASFDVPIEQAHRGLPASVLAEPAVTFYAARRHDPAAAPSDSEPVVGMLALTRFGTTVSIDLMAVAPAAQRRGIGRALMLSAMQELSAAGATGFHLLSSPEGKRLYDQVGFTTLLPTVTRFIPVEPIPADQVVP